MSEGQFFSPQAGMTIADIARLTGAEARPGTPLDRPIRNVAPIDLAGPEDLAFLENAKFAGDLATCRAGALLTTARFEPRAPAGIAVLISRAPYRAFVVVTREFYPAALRPAAPYESSGVAPGATVHPTARLAAAVTVDPGAVIGPRVEIGPGTIVAANAVIGADVRIGRDCNIGPNSSIVHTLIGDRVIVHPGCHIGQDGFGYVPTEKGHLKVPQIGRVLIEDDVEIGAGTKIDRGGMRDTVIGAGTKIDNLVQIGHNVVVGRHSVIVAQSGLSGSVTIEDGVMIGAAVGIAPHIRIGKGAMVAARSGLKDDIPPGESWGGYPARPMMQWGRELAAVKDLARRKPKPS